MMRKYLILLLLMLLTAGCGVFVPKLLPLDLQATESPRATSTPRAPITATPALPGATATATRLPTATPNSVAPANSDDAIRLAQQSFPALKGIQKKPAGSLGASTDIIVQERGGGWNIIFWQGSGDCTAGCINNHYWYVAVEKSGGIALSGEYERAFDSGSNSVKTTGAPLWGVPRP